VDTLESLARRLDRMESLEAIRALPARYANAMDARDFDAAVALYTEDAPVSPGVRGRAALKEGFGNAMGTYFTTTVHFIGNHLIELDPENPDRATGHVYCRAEHEQGDNWVIVMVHYSDKYRRDDGTWYFYSRRMRVWYTVDVLDRPTGPDKVRFVMSDVDLHAPHAELPAAWPSWHEFWAGRTDEQLKTPRPST
jgi:ketosteroid isomerase-like protein